eukprot:11014105-Alexandrium_andersonii.AAC.1
MAYRREPGRVEDRPVLWAPLDAHRRGLIHVGRGVARAAVDAHDALLTVGAVEVPHGDEERQIVLRLEGFELRLQSPGRVLLER